MNKNKPKRSASHSFFVKLAWTEEEDFIKAGKQVSLVHFSLENINKEYHRDAMY